MFLYLFAFVVFLVLDIAFLSFNRNFFELQVIDIQRVSMQFNYLPAIAAYVVLIFAFYWFILKNRRPIIDAVLLGGVINGTFELTNMALLKKWHLQTVLLDTTWGAFLWGFTTYLTYKVFPRK